MKTATGRVGLPGRCDRWPFQLPVGTGCKATTAAETWRDGISTDKMVSGIGNLWQTYVRLNLNRCGLVGESS